MPRMRFLFALLLSIMMYASYVWASGFSGGGGVSYPLLAPAGTVGAPSYSFTGDATSGLYDVVAGTIGMAISGADAARFNAAGIATISGTNTTPSVTDITNGNTGLFWPSSNALGIGNATDGLWCRWLSQIYTCTRGSADASGYAFQIKKARGTMNAPTVITTGDTLFTQSSYGYVGATNTYVEATRIEHVASGTITDATTGIGGVINFATSKQGLETTPSYRLRLDAFGHLSSIGGTANTPTINTCTNGTLTGGTDNAFLVSFTGANSTCSINFGTTWLTNAPVCVMSEKTVTATTVGDITATTSLVTITPSAAYANTDTVNVICLGRL